MIKQILIKNYILIEELLVKFDKGLNVITGETGAGKSIIINAIDSVFAPRVSKDVIKTGCEKSSIELILSCSKNDLTNFFEENGIDNFGDEIVITKEITQNAVRARVNGTLVNQDFIKILKDKFLDIHSQHQTYAFLQPKYHINLLDTYAKDVCGEMLSDYRDKFAQYKTLCADLDNAKNLSNATESQIEFLKFQIDEIENANIEDVNEYDDLKNELSILENTEKLKELTGSAYWALNGDENSIISALEKIKGNISKASQMDENLKTTEEDLINSAEVIHELASTLRDYSQNLNNDTERLNEIQERIFTLDKLKRKYGNTLTEVMTKLERLKSEYNKIKWGKKNIEELEIKINKILEELNVKADEITLIRQDFAIKLSKLIIEKLERLELPKSKFKISIEPEELNDKGKDKVEFLISTNISEDLKPLAKVASGGEVSRVMLAIKSIFAQSDDIDTVIFDEIDTGISGRASQSVAEEISELAKYHQIILITHQPIIASKAEKHFYVTKRQESGQTEVGVYVLSGDNRIKALAELAGGEINEQSMEFARSLIS